MQLKKDPLTFLRSLEKLQRGERLKIIAVMENRMNVSTPGTFCLASGCWRPTKGDPLPASTPLGTPANLDTAEYQLFFLVTYTSELVNDIVYEQCGSCSTTYSPLGFSYSPSGVADKGLARSSLGSSSQTNDHILQRSQCVPFGNCRVFSGLSREYKPYRTAIQNHMDNII